MLKGYSVTIVPDTNSVFSKKPHSTLLGNGFAAELARVRTICATNVLVPLVVEQELLYRKTNQLRRAVGATDDLQRLVHNLSARKFPVPFAAKDVEQIATEISAADQKANGWLVYSPKLDNADWPEITRWSAMRLPPFSNSEDPEVEKGFRDCLVLESFIEIAASHPATRCVLLTGDKRLLDALTPRMPKNGECVADLKDLRGQLELLKKKHSAEEARELQFTAAETFGRGTTRTGLFFDQDLKAKIKKQFPDVFVAGMPVAQLTFVAAPNLFSVTQGLTGVNWSPRASYRSSGREKVRIGGTTFADQKGTLFSWETSLEFISLFQKEVSAVVTFGYSQDPPFYLRHSQFTASWSCQIENGRASAGALGNIRHDGTSWEAAHTAELSRYGWMCSDTATSLFGYGNVMDMPGVLGSWSDLVD